MQPNRCVMTVCIYAHKIAVFIKISSVILETSLCVHFLYFVQRMFKIIQEPEAKTLLLYHSSMKENYLSACS
jgi:hypothetical protein